MKVNWRSKRSERFLFNSSEVSVVSVLSEEKERSECSQRFHFNSSEVSVVSVLSEEKEGSECSQRFHFNSSETKNTVVSIVRYFILVVLK